MSASKYRAANTHVQSGAFCYSLLSSFLDNEKATGTYYFVVPAAGASACNAQSVSPSPANISGTTFPHG
jgi:hypothetical protein